MPYRKVQEGIEWITLNIANGAFMVMNWEKTISILVGAVLILFNLARTVKVVQEILEKRRDRKMVEEALKESEKDE